MRSAKSLCLGLGSLLSLLPQAALATTISERVGQYEDNEGLERQRMSYDMLLDNHPAVANMSGLNTEVIATRDQYQRSQMTGDTYDQDTYGGSYHATDSVSVTSTATWDRVTETRVIAAYATDQQVTSKTWGVGSSQWYRDETIRLSLDLSRTVLTQPLYQVLDTDFQNVGNPTIGTSTGVTMAVRHLATPTTVVDYTVSHMETDNRPDTNSGTVAIRQYIPYLAGAVHADITRALNRGYVTVYTTYGQVDAWIYDLAYLQTLWQGARARLGYRYYKEDETTRAWGDDLVFGSDTVSLTLSQDLPRGVIEAIGVPLTIDLVGSRYLTNVGIAASSIEAGATAKF